MQLYQSMYHSPIGTILIKASDQGITQVSFMDHETPEIRQDNQPLLIKCVTRLDEYFNSKRRNFSLAVNPSGTPFQLKVWDALSQIPYGKTQTYGRIAAIIGNPKAARAVGMANNKNKIAIIIPCHRVIGADGKPVGYGAGLWRKEWLLKHERK